jgi:hypothetical protein
MGEKYHLLAHWYKKLKEVLNQPKQFRYNFRGQANEEKAACTQFCTQLKDLGFLSKYRYLRQQNAVVATPSKDGQIINFFSGGWFEIYITQKLIKLLNTQHINYVELKNIHIVFPDDRQGELDLVFFIKEIPFVIECKTGEFEPALEKCKTIRQQLNLSTAQMIMVVLDIDRQRCIDLTELHTITVVNQDIFIEVISKAMQDLLPPK